MKKFYSPLLLIAIGLLACSETKKTDASTSVTDWFSASKYGLFIHFLPSGPDYQKPINAFDVEGFADDCAAAGAGYVMFSLGQNSGYFCSPSSTYDSITGVKAGEKRSLRDLPMDLANALAKRNIRLMLYVPGDIPAYDSIAAIKLGGREFVRNENGENWRFNDTLTYRWAKVIREWSERYKELVAGWWVDGCYNKSGFMDAHAKVLHEAMKAGNPNSIICFNSGLNYNKTSVYNDYLAGEERRLLEGRCAQRFVDGAQWHELSFLGEDWGSGAPQYTAQQIVEHLKSNVNANGGVLTMDVRLDDSGSRIHPDHLAVLKDVKKSIHP